MASSPHHLTVSSHHHQGEFISPDDGDDGSFSIGGSAPHHLPDAGSKQPPRAPRRDTVRVYLAARAAFARKYRLRRPSGLSASALEWLHTGRTWTHSGRVQYPRLDHPLGDHLLGWQAMENRRRPYAVVSECYLRPEDALAEAQRIAAACGLHAELLPITDTVHWAAYPEIAAGAGVAVISFIRASDRPLSERGNRR